MATAPTAAEARGSPTSPGPPSSASTSSGSSRIREALERFGDRFVERVLTPRRGRATCGRPPETFAGRWAAKEAVSKVLGLGVRGIGWRDIEIERLPDRPARRAAPRARALRGPTSWAWAGSRSASPTSASTRSPSRSASARAGGRYVFPPDIEERLDERERRPRGAWTGSAALAARGRALAAGATADGERDDDRCRPGALAARALDDQARRRAAAGPRPARPQGDVRQLLIVAGSLDYAGAALLVCQAAGRAGAGLVTLAVPESLQPVVAGPLVEATTLGLPERAPWEVDPEAALAALHAVPHDALVVGPGLRRSVATAALVLALLATEGAPAVVDAEALNALAADRWWAARCGGAAS